MTDTITGYAHLDKIADEIGDDAGTCDADYAFQRSAALMIYNLRNALEVAEYRAEKAEAESARLRAVLESITDIVNAAPELNMSNYDEDQVSALNDDMINVCRILQQEAARRAVAGEM